MQQEWYTSSSQIGEAQKPERQTGAQMHRCSRLECSVHRHHVGISRQAWAHASSAFSIAHHHTAQHGDSEIPSSGDEGEIVSAEGPPARELKPSVGEQEVIVPDFQEPLISSGEDEPLDLTWTQVPQETLGSTPWSPTLASWPALEKRLLTGATSPSSMAVDTEETTPSGTQVAPIPTTTMTRRDRFKGLNGRHFQQQGQEDQLPGAAEPRTQPSTLEVTADHMRPSAATEALEGDQSHSPWAILTNEVDEPGAGE